MDLLDSCHLTMLGFYVYNIMFIKGHQYLEKKKKFIKNKITHSYNFQDLTEQKFNRLIVKQFHSLNKEKRAMWQCQCDCGKLCIISANHLKKGQKSCGCLKKEKCIYNIKQPIKKGQLSPRFIHGMSKTNFYYVFRGLQSRCNNQKIANYKYYGGKGIKCCWNSFEDFKKDMHQGYLQHCKKYGRKNTQIDRINNNKSYYKNNCRWVTIQEQQNNTSRNRIIQFQNKKYNMKQWSVFYGLNYFTFRYRFKKHFGNYSEACNQYDLTLIQQT